MLCVTHRNTPMWTDGARHRVTPMWPQPPGPPRRSAEGPGGPDACQLRDMLALPHGQKVPREPCPGLQCKRLAEATRGLFAFMAGAGGGGALSCIETTQEAGGPRGPIRARMEPLPGHPLHQVPAARRPGGAETPGVRAELPPLHVGDSASVGTVLQAHSSGQGSAASPDSAPSRAVVCWVDLYVL